jgi:hypothetical protein
MHRRAFLLLPAAAAAGCGYHVGGKADLLPSTIRTIAIPPFGNETTRYKLTNRLPGAIAHEFLARTRYRVVPNPSEADAVLRGDVLLILSAPTVFDSTTGRAAGVQLSVFVRIRLTERETGKVLFERPSMEIRQRYEVSIEEQQYFEESGPALDRLCGDVARYVVSAVLEAF